MVPELPGLCFVGVVGCIGWAAPDVKSCAREKALASSDYGRGESGHRDTLESLVSRNQAHVDRSICFDLWRHKLRGNGAVLLDHRCTRLSKVVFPVRGNWHEFVSGLLCYRGFRFQVGR